MRINEYAPPINWKVEWSLKEARYRPAATRRPRLTLMHLNKLKVVRELRALEKEKRRELVANIYWNEEETEYERKKEDKGIDVSKKTVQSIKVEARRK